MNNISYATPAYPSYTQQPGNHHADLSSGDRYRQLEQQKQHHLQQYLIYQGLAKQETRDKAVGQNQKISDWVATLAGSPANVSADSSFPVFPTSVAVEDNINDFISYEDIPALSGPENDHDSPLPSSRQSSISTAAVHTPRSEHIKGGISAYYTLPIGDHEQVAAAVSPLNTVHDLNHLSDNVLRPGHDKRDWTDITSYASMYDRQVPFNNQPTIVDKRAKVYNNHAPMPMQPNQVWDYNFTAVAPVPQPTYYEPVYYPRQNIATAQQPQMTSMNPIHLTTFAGFANEPPVYNSLSNFAPSAVRSSVPTYSYQTQPQNGMINNGLRNGAFFPQAQNTFVPNTQIFHNAEPFMAVKSERLSPFTASEQQDEDADGEYDEDVEDNTALQRASSINEALSRRPSGLHPQRVSLAPTSRPAPYAKRQARDSISGLSSSSSLGNGSVISKNILYQDGEAKIRNPLGGGRGYIPGETPDDPKKKHKCNVCGRGFARLYNLKSHAQTHDPLREKPFPCPHTDCTRSFSRLHDLERHRQGIHSDGPLMDAKIQGIAPALARAQERVHSRDARDSTAAPHH